MLSDNGFLAPDLYKYLIDEGIAEHSLLSQLRKTTAELPESQWQTPPEQSRFLAFMVSLIEAVNVLEIGTFTGYGTLAMAQSLPDDGRIVTLDVDDTFPSIGRPFWQQSGLEDKIDLRTGLALETLSNLIDDGECGNFDLVFIDADKKEYDGYYEKSLTLLRQGGLMIIDNMLWGGAVIDPDDQRNSTKALRKLIKKIKVDDRVDTSFIPLADGVLMARKK